MKKHIKIILSALLLIFIVVILIFSFNIPGLMSSLFFQSAEKAYLNGDDYGARTNFRFAISLAPKSEQLRLDCVRLLLGSGDTEYATALLKDSVAALPNSMPLHEMLMKTISATVGYPATIAYIDQLNNEPIVSQVQQARPEEVAVYPSPGIYQQVVSLQFSGENIFYNLTRSQIDSGSFLKMTEPIVLTNGNYYLRAISVSESGLVSPLFEGNYVVRQQNQIVSFEDGRIEGTIRKIINKSEGVIFSDELLHIKTLTLHETYLPMNDEEAQPVPSLSLADLKWLPELTELHIIGPIHLSEMEQLTTLLNLENLQLKDCGLANGDLAVLSELRRLNTLDLSNNTISDPTVLAVLDRLETLTLSNNRLLTVEALAGMQTLEYLELAGNRIENIRPLANLLNLKRLNLTQNNVHAISSIKHMKQLLYLNVSFNNLPNLAGIEALENLQELNATGNRIYDITAVTNLQNIKNLDLSENNIHNILPLAGIPVTTLNLANNNISSVLVLNSMVTLEELNMSNNPIFNLAPTEHLKRLKKLICVGCPIKNFDLLSLPTNVEIQR